jgi:hypothetical protein
MQRRKFIAGIGSLAAAGVAAVGTGAFTSVSANRTVDVQVASDDSALLSLAAASAPNGVFADGSGSGTMSVAFDESGNGGLGVSQDATTVFRNVFRIENRGTQRVEVNLASGSGRDEPVRIHPKGSIGNENKSIRDPLDAEGVAASLALKHGRNVYHAFLPVGDAVNVHFKVKTDDDGGFPAVNPLEIEADAA